MKEIIAFIEPFVLKQAIYISGDDSQVQLPSADLSTLPSVIAQACHDNQINQIKISGPTELAQKIGRDIEAVACTYELANLEINYI